MHADPALLFGHDPRPGVVAVEHLAGRGQPDRMRLYQRRGADTVTEECPFHPCLHATADLAARYPGPCERTTLAGDAPLNVRVTLPDWAAWQEARRWFAHEAGGAPDAPWFALADPVQQFLVASGITLFKGMTWPELRRLQLDIECLTEPGYDFCNAERAGDRIVAVGLADSTGRREVLHGDDERALLARLVATLRDWDPDVIEGHNVFNFDLPYLTTRAKRHKVRLAIGRDGSVPARRVSRVTFGERTLSYDRVDIAGRHVVDTLFLVHAYDITHRSLDGFGLKAVARHFGVAAPDRTGIDGDAITAVYRADPERLLRYVADDVRETGAISELLAPSYFAQAGMLPFSYQNVCVRGTATKIDALLLRAYYHAGQALPLPAPARPFAGGYTDLFREGVLRNVHHCDVRSLYPSLMLRHQIAPAADRLGVFAALLRRLRDLRVDAKARMQAAADPRERNGLDALQTTFKVLINSFYGYLGFAQGRFSDFDAAERVTAEGRALLQRMIATLRELGADPIEIDTDGIYFVPPPGDAARFRQAFTQALPAGIDVEFDAEYAAMFSYKMKNYALLDAAGELVVKGAALKSRGIEPFQREFMEELLRMKLEGREADIPGLHAAYRAAIQERRWPIRMFAKTETLQDSPATYAAKRDRTDRGRNAAYELALASGREYRAGDQVAYYVAGVRKTVAVCEAARLLSDWRETARDENIAYYTAKLDALYAKFAGGGAQGEFAL